MFTKQEAEEAAKNLYDYMVENQTPGCLACLANMHRSEHTLTNGMIVALMKFARACVDLKLREANPREAINAHGQQLYLDERSNWTKLRFFGLVAKYKENGVQKGGKWVVTRNGWAFLRSELAVPKFIRTFRNKIVEKSTETVKIFYIYGSQPNFPSQGDLFNVPVEGEDLNIVKLAKKKERAKRRKNPCPNCIAGTLKKKSRATFDDGLAHATFYEECETCGFSQTIERA